MEKRTPRPAIALAIASESLFFDIFNKSASGFLHAGRRDIWNCSVFLRNGQGVRGGARLFGLRVSDGRMMGDVGESQPNQPVIRVSASVVDLVGMVYEIDSFRCASLFGDFLEQFAFPGQMRRNRFAVLGGIGLKKSRQ